MSVRLILIFVCSFVALVAWGDILLTNYALHLPMIPHLSTIHSIAVVIWLSCLGSWVFLLYYNIKHHRSCCASCLADHSHCPFDDE